MTAQADSSAEKRPADEPERRGDRTINDPAPAEVLRNGFALVRRSWRLRPLAHLLGTTGAILYALASVAFSWTLGRVADDVVVPSLDGGNVANAEIWTVLGVLIAIGATRAVGAMARRWFQSLAEYGTQRVWRELLLSKYLDLPLSWHRRVQSGELLTHADTDLERSTRMLKPLAFAIGTFALATFSFLALLRIHVLMAAVAVVLFPTLSVLNRRYTMRVAAASHRERAENGFVSSITHESFDGALVVKTLGREQAETRRMRVAAERLRDTRIEIGGVRAVFDPMIEALPSVGVIALVVVGAWLVDQGSATVGELITAVSLFTILAVPVRVVGFFLEEMPGSTAALSRVDSVIDEPQPESDQQRTRSLPTGPLSVSIKGVSFDYQSVPESELVLDDVSLDIAAGSSIAIVGSTGSGKSTLVNLIAGLAMPTKGSLLVGDVPIGEVDPVVRAERIVTVFQEAFLFATTIRENVTLGNLVSSGRVSEDRVSEDRALIAALTSAEAWDFVQELPEGLDTIIGERGVTLSGGQRQRVALARALIREPSIVLLDDATSALDPAIERLVLDRLRAELRATLVIVAYRLATIEVADRVVYLVDGRVAATGVHAELMNRPDYAALVRAYETSAG